MACQPEDVIQLLQAMVRIDSVNANVSGNPLAEAPLGDLLVSVAEGMGLAVRRLPIDGRADNLLVTFERDPLLPWVMFESHMDTVSTEGMTIDALGGELRDGRVWGRGSCDTKGSGAAMLWALREYARSSTGGRNVAIAYAIDEELGMVGVRQLIDTHWPTFGFKPVGVIVGEPTMLRPVAAHNGVVRWTITTTGAAAHSADPSQGRSAISDMVRVIQRIESRHIPSLQARHPLTGKAQCSINMIRGGTQANIIPERCDIQIDRRLVPGEDHTAVVAELDPLLDELRSEDPALRIDSRVRFDAPPLSDEVGGDILKIVQSALSAMAMPTTPMGVAYATDAGDLSEAGIDAVVIGPGDIAHAHTKDEFLEIAQLELAVELYGAIMRQA